MAKKKKHVHKWDIFMGYMKHTTDYEISITCGECDEEMTTSQAEDILNAHERRKS